MEEINNPHEDQINWIIDALDELGYNLTSNDPEEFLSKAITQGVQSTFFRELVQGLIAESKRFDEYSIKDSNSNNGTAQATVELASMDIESSNTSHFTRDVKSFLDRQQYDWISFYKNHNVDQNDFDSNFELVEILIGEVQSCRILASKRLSSESILHVDTIHQTKESKLENQIAATATHLKIIPDSHHDHAKTLKSILSKIQDILATVPPSFVGDSLLKVESFSKQQLLILEEINATLKQDYEQRKKVLLKRLAVTFQTFLWSEKGEENGSSIKAMVQQQQNALTPNCSIDIYEVFAAKDDLLSIVKTSQESAKSSLKTIVIGAVPDRGGRVEERSGSQMPSFKKREELAIGGSFAHQSQPQRSHGKKKKGGRVHAGWKQQKDSNNNNNNNDDGNWEGSKRSKKR